MPTEKQVDAPKPCPFCGGTDLKSGGDDKFVGTRCQTCEATGPNQYGCCEWNTRTALEAAQPRVKPLEWNGNRVETPIGIYYVGRIGNDWTVHRGHTDAGDFFALYTGTATDFDAALIEGKAAAQADYEARILSALEWAAQPQWMPIETAPRDGTWMRLWRGQPCLGDWDCEVIAKWHVFDDGDATWVWPDNFYDPWHEPEYADALINSGDYYEDNKNFTHWMPLTTPPALTAEGE